MISNRTRIFSWRWLAASALVCLVTTSNAVAYDDPNHADSGRQDPWNNCTGCHGNDLKGSFGPSCMSAFGDPSGIGIGGCHQEFTEPDLPPTSHHFPGRDDPFNNCTGCHGDELEGGSGPSCFQCHGDLWSGGENLPPVSDPNGPYFGTVGVAVTFNGSGSSDPDGTIDSYDWDFGDGNTGTGVSPMHTYDAEGLYTVTLTVTDNGGLTDTFDTSADIAAGGDNQPPVSDPGSLLYYGQVGVPVTFDGSGSTDPDGMIVSYEWDFGDGNTGSGVSPTHTYDAEGFYTVTLTVTDDGGLTDSKETGAQINAFGSNLPPDVDPGGPYSGVAGEPVFFDASGTTDPEEDPLTFVWTDWGDDSFKIPPDMGETTSHTYESADIYTATLTVFDGTNFVPVEFEVVITNGETNLPPTADAGGPYDDGIAGQPVTFNGSGSSDPDGDPLTYSWDFGDGNTGVGMIPSHTYTAAGTYTVTLIVNDGLADSLPDTATVVIVPPNDPPVADAGGPYTGTEGTEVQFDGSGSFDPDGDPLTYQWDFGDGSTGEGVMPTHTYTAAGNFTAVLTVSDGINDPVVDNGADVTITNDTDPPVPGDADWEIRLPLVPDAGTLNFEEFAGVLFVEAKYGGAGTVFGIGFQMQPFTIWMDSKGALFLGADRGDDMMGIVFSFMGNTDTIWFAEPLAPAAEEEDGMGLLGGLLGMFF